MKELLQSALRGEVAAISRLISLAEAGGSRAEEVQEAVFPRTGRAHLLGVTGPAGVGKSTLINRLAAELAANGCRPAVLACDPSSPATGGALLGDRIRMGDLVSNSKVFIRSLATRGSGGSLPAGAVVAADILDACGFSPVMIETVGTGQNQTDILQVAHTLLALYAPGLGDGIQAMKSGVAEMADLHVINKSDLAGAGRAAMEIESALRLRSGGRPQGQAGGVVRVSGIEGTGVADLAQSIRDHWSYLQQNGRLQLRQRRMFDRRVRREAAEVLAQSIAAVSDDHLAGAIERLMRRDCTPGRAARDLLGQCLRDLV